MKLWKVQKFFGDLVYDLRQRGLLPVAGLLLVAIVAVPLVIARSGSDDAAPVAPLDPAALSVPENESAVLAYEPGVRDYKKRLEALQAKNPFIQQFAGGGADAAALGGDFVTTIGGGDGASSGGSATVGGATTDTGSSGSTQVGADPGPAPHRPPSVVIKTKYLTYRMNVAFGEVGSMSSRVDVEPLSFLPNQQLPVLVFLGVGGDGSKAMFLVSSDVTAADGQGTCVPNSSSPCYLLVLRTGQVEDLTYGPNGKTYRLKVTAIRESSAG